MSVKNYEMGLSLIECRTGRVTLSPKPSSHAGLFGRFGNGKNKAVWARLRWRLIRWRGVFLMPSTRLEIIKNATSKNENFAHMAARWRACWQHNRTYKSI